MNCSRCQHPLADEALYCSSCGVSTSRMKQESEPTVRNVTATNPNDNQQTNPKSDQHIGLVLDSKYKLLEVLGQGGMGSVYLAQRLHIGDQVAVKLLSPELLRDEQTIERFRREARAAAMIRHPNVVSIYDFSDASGATAETYIVMELVKGVSLRTILQRDGRLSPARAVAVMQDVCAGVGAAHREGLLHRDLKPDNVIIAPPTSEGDRETAKVVDFGLAKIHEENSTRLTKSGILMGTLSYMSPEQCRGEDLDAHTDVYSLGAMLYEMLSGQPPFNANNQAGLIAKHLYDIPARFDRVLQIPTSLERVCFRALAKGADERQPDAIALGKELLATLAQSSEGKAEQLIGLPVGPPERKTNLLHWVIGFAVVAVLGLTLVAVGIAIKLWVDRSTGSGNSSPSVADQSQTPTTPDEKKPNSTISVGDLRGTWKGTYGSLNQPARLIITRHEGEALEGVLEQSGQRVAFEGTITSDKIVMKQTKVLSGEGWVLGEDSGTVSSDGKRIDGTGKDALSESLGMTYNWSFTR